MAGSGIFRWRFRFGSGCLGEQIVTSHGGKLAVLPVNANEGNRSDGSIEISAGASNQ
jgi:hypothetical protein